MEVAVRKFCCICTRDVRKIRRVKDRRGNYFCRPCYEERLREYKARLARNSAAVDESGDSVPRPATESHACSVVEQPATKSPGLFERRWFTTALWSMPLAGVILVASLDRDPQIRLAAVFGMIALSGVALVLWARTRDRLSSASRDLGVPAPAAPPQENVSAASPDQPILSIVPTEPAETVVEVRRRIRRRPGSRTQVRISDLLGHEAQAEVEAANHDPERAADPDVPVSPQTNPAITAMVDEFAPLFLPQPAGSGRKFAIHDSDDAFNSTPFRLG
jgi:hypothetical protein